MRTTIKDLIIQNYKGKFKIVCLERCDWWKAKENFLKENVFKLSEPIEGYCINTLDEAPFFFLYGAIVETIEDEAPVLKDGMWISFKIYDDQCIGYVVKEGKGFCKVRYLSKYNYGEIGSDELNNIEWKEIKL